MFCSLTNNGTDELMTTERMNIINLNAGEFILESGVLEKVLKAQKTRVLF